MSHMVRSVIARPHRLHLCEVASLHSVQDRMLQLTMAESAMVTRQRPASPAPPRSRPGGRPRRCGAAAPGLPGAASTQERAADRRAEVAHAEAVEVREPHPALHGGRH